MVIPLQFDLLSVGLPILLLATVAITGTVEYRAGAGKVRLLAGWAITLVLPFAGFTAWLVLRKVNWAR